MLKSLLLLCAVGVTTCLPPFRDEVTSRHGEQCGYESCPETDKDILNVHIVPHTHDDVGWLKTVDQYYYGSKNRIQKAGVQYILDSVVKELWEDSKRRFIYVETAFFWKWWVRQTDDVRHKVHTLVRQGRLQFVGGAWSMNDEAASHYQSTIDQFTWGLSKLNETFGPCGLPRVGWQIDPFGHSREFASLLSAMGYDGLFLGRIDYQDKKERLHGKNMEMVWRGDDDLGKQSDIFTGILYNTYSPPPGFCFDVLCDDEPIVDDPNSPLFNVDEKIAMFFDYVTKQAPHYRTNNVVITMGGDFTYQDATMWYKNLDKLIAYSNLKAAKDGLNIKLFYSTPTCYLKAVRDAKPTLPTKQDDFFPYASDPTAYWTGYFTSRPTTKFFEREGNGYLQMAKQLQVLAGLKEHNKFVLNELKSAMGIMQHHDAITGTEKEHVTHDYERILNQAIDDSLIIARQAFNKITQRDALKPALLSYDRCHINESRCYTSENSETFIVTVYNALGWEVKEAIRVPVPHGTYEVYAPNGEKLKTQLVNIPKQVLKIPSRKSTATHQLVFIGILHPLGYKSFYVKKINKFKRDTTLTLSNDYYNNIDEFWNGVRDKTRIDFQNIDGSVLSAQADGNIDAVKIPIEPINSKQVNTVKNIDLDVLKDRDDGMNEKLDELDKLIKAVRSRFDARSYRPRPIDDGYTNLNEEEMRMLSDDPSVYNEIIDDKNDGKRHRTDQKVTISFYYYPGCVGDNEEPRKRSSGAYIFRPNATKPIKLTARDTVVIDGDIVKEERTSMVEQSVLGIRRYYKDLDFVEHEWVVGPIDIEDNIGKEIVVKYQTDIINNGEFYTDSNGRQVLKRKLNQRPQWNLTLAEPIAGNYYPVVNEIFIENSKERMTVLTDRAQGGTSLVEGEIELMLHRRLLHDDAFGVGEALNEVADGLGLVVTGKHRILFTKDKITELKNILQLHLQPIVFASDASHVTYEDWLKLKNCNSFLKKQLPDGLHLLTLEPWGSKLLIRIENYLNRNTNSTIDVDLSELFADVAVKSVKETTLSANQWLDDYKKLSWKKESEFYENFNNKYGSFDDAPKADDHDGEVSDDGLKIKIKAKEIRTFIADYELR